MSDLLAELGALADEQDWPAVRAFLDQLRGPSLLVAAAGGLDAITLAQWLRESNPALDVRVEPLASLAANPGPALAADRVVIALRGGELLSPDAIDGAEVILRRPGGASAIVVTGTEQIRTEDDLAAVNRVVTGSLTGSRRSAEFRLWAADPVSGFLSGRLEEDMASLSRWSRALSSPSADLAAARAAYALDLALSLVDRTPAAEIVAATPALRDSVASLHRRVLGQLDADAATLRRELLAALDTLNADVRHDLDHARPGTNPRLLVERRTTAWSVETSQLIQSRQARARKNVLDLLDSADWTEIDLLARRHDGRGYREAITDATTPQVVAPPRAASMPASAPVQPAASGAKPFRTAAIGGVVTAATLAVLGVAVVPILVAGAAGVAAGAAIENGFGRRARQNEPATDVRAAIQADLADAMATAIKELDRIESTTRVAVDAEFADLERELSAKPIYQPAPAGPAVDEQLAALRDRLTSTRRQR